MRNSSKLVWLLTLVFLGAAYPLLAQLPTGTILGVVKDSTSAVIPNVSITVRNVDTAQERTVETGPDGAYRIPALPVGHYSVKAEHPAFKTETQVGLTLEVSQEEVINFTLQVGTTQQQVVVTGEAPLVDTTNSSLGAVVNEDKMADLPLNGRNYVDLTLIQPGVTNDVNFGGSSGQGGTGGTYFSSNGAPVRSNNFTLDGAQLVNQIGGGGASAAGTTLGVDGIKEFKIITNSFSAEYGMFMGSQVVLVSKGGSNQFSGDVFEYLRNSDLDARNFFDYGYQAGLGRLPHFERNNFGGSFGGPIKKDKTFFYGVYEGLRQELGQTVVDTVPGAGCHGAAGAKIVAGTGPGQCPQLTTSSVTISPVSAPLLALFPLPNLPNNSFTFPTVSPTRVDYGQMRVDQSFSASDSFFARYTVDDAQQLSSVASATGATGGTGYPQFGTNLQSRDQFITLSENHIFSSEVLNMARFSFSRTNLLFANTYPGGVNAVSGPGISLMPGEPIGDLVISGVAQFGPNTNYPEPELQNIYSLSDDLYYTKGHHALKFGVLAQRFNQALDSGDKIQGQANFTGVTAFLQGTTSATSALTPGGVTNRYFIYSTVGLYAQDDWKVRPRLTLNLGLRYEFNTTPVETNGRQYAFRSLLTDATTTPGPIMSNPSLKNFSPRVGFAWDVTGKGKTSIRGAFGEYYDLSYLGGAVEMELFGTPPLTSFSATTNAPLAVPLAFSSANVASNIETMDYNAKQPYMLQYNLTVEQQLPFSMGLSASYVGSRGIHLYNIKEGNPCIPTTYVNGSPEWTASCGLGRVNPHWGSDELVSAAGDSWYNSLQILLTKRLNRGLEFQNSFTYSKSLDTTEGEHGGGECQSGSSALGVDPWNEQIDKGVSCFDTTYNDRINILYHFPNIASNNFAAKLLHGWWMGNIVSLQSGYAFTPVLGAQRSNSGTLSTNGGVDRANLGTTTTTVTINNTSYTFIPFNKDAVITHNPQQWFNPLMFDLQPVGFLGSVARNLLRGPGLTNWDFSLVKDTSVPFLGENGKVEFRGEFFNLLNIANFGMPTTAVFAGTLTSTGTYSQAPNTSAGQITRTVNTSRQVQLALKLIF